MPRAISILLVVLLGFVAAEKPATQPATTQKGTTTTTTSTSPSTTQASRPRRPTTETVTVELTTDTEPSKRLPKAFHRLPPPVKPSAGMMGPSNRLLEAPVPTRIPLGAPGKFDGPSPARRGTGPSGMKAF